MKEAAEKRFPLEKSNFLGSIFLIFSLAQKDDEEKDERGRKNKTWNGRRFLFIWEVSYFFFFFHSIPGAFSSAFQKSRKAKLIFQVVAEQFNILRLPN